MPDGNAQNNWTTFRAAKYVILSLLLAVIAFVGWQYWLAKGGIFSTSRFNTSGWKATPSKDDDFSCFRGGMANDLKGRVLLPGMSRESVERLLGNPTQSRAKELQYDLGMCSGLGIDFDILHVYFNEHGELERVAIIQH
jgi:hypothetical protein